MPCDDVRSSQPHGQRFPHQFKTQSSVQEVRCPPGRGAGTDVEGDFGGRLSRKKSLSVIKYSMLITTFRPFSFMSTVPINAADTVCHTLTNLSATVHNS